MSQCSKDIPSASLPCKPYTSHNTVRDITQQLYGLKVKTIKDLVSFDDRNYLITVDNDSVNSPHIKNIWPHGYVFKILNSKDSQNTDIIEGHIAIMSYLKERGFNVQKCVKNIHGEYLHLEKMKIDTPEVHGEQYAHYIIRLFTFLPGEMIESLPYTEQLLYDAGRYCGSLDAHLKDFHHHGYGGHTFQWSLASVGTKIVEMIDFIKDPEKNKLIQSVVQSFHSKIEPNFGNFQSSIIHGDCNEANLVVSENPNQEDVEDSKRQHHVSGIIDFGDSSQGYVVWEVAILMMHLMYSSRGRIDVLSVGGHVLAGFLSQMQLNETERDLLKECIAARFAMALTVCTYTYENVCQNEYVLSVIKMGGWDILRQLWMTPKSEIYAIWQEIIDSYNNNV